MPLLPDGILSHLEQDPDSLPWPVEVTLQPGPGYSNPHLTHTPTLRSMLFLLLCLLTISQDTPTPFLPQDLRT